MVPQATALTVGARVRSRPPEVHPWAWWGWALGTATAVSMTTNPLLLALIALCVLAVIVLRRTDAPWARSIGAYLALAAIVIVIRMSFQIVVGAGLGSTVLFTLPELTLPDWAAGIRLGGPVMAEGIYYAFCDALRLGVMLICLGAANALANPRRALRSVPAALYEASVAVVIALSFAPQLIESIGRVRRARQLRGGSGTGWRAVRGVAMPVLADAIDRSLALAASMEVRGFGRTRDGARPTALGTAATLLAMGAVVFGGFGLLSGGSDVWWAVPLLVAGVAGTIASLRGAGRRLRVTRYRPQPWLPRDGALVALGVAAALAYPMLALVVPGDLGAVWQPPIDPLTWPDLHPAMAIVLAAVVAAVPLSPAPEPASRPEATREPEAATTAKASA